MAVTIAIAMAIAIAIAMAIAIAITIARAIAITPGIPREPWGSRVNPRDPRGTPGRETQKSKQKGTANTGGRAREARAPPVLFGIFLITFLSSTQIFSNKL